MPLDFRPLPDNVLVFLSFFFLNTLIYVTSSGSRSKIIQTIIYARRTHVSWSKRYNNIITFCCIIISTDSIRSRRRSESHSYNMWRPMVNTFPFINIQTHGYKQSAGRSLIILIISSVRRAAAVCCFHVRPVACDGSLSGRDVIHLRRRLRSNANDLVTRVLGTLIMIPYSAIEHCCYSVSIKHRYNYTN